MCQWFPLCYAQMSNALNNLSFQFPGRSYGTERLRYACTGTRMFKHCTCTRCSYSCCETPEIMTLREPKFVHVNILDLLYLCSHYLPWRQQSLLTYIRTSPSPCLTTAILAVRVLVKSAHSVVPKLNKKPSGRQRHLPAAEAFQELRRFGARRALWPKLKPGNIGGNVDPAWIEMPSNDLPATEAFQELRRFGTRRALRPKRKPGTIGGNINPAWIKMPNDEAPLVVLLAPGPQV
jgi:hypothetical protein